MGKAKDLTGYGVSRMNGPKILILDVDGVLTDGTKLYENGKPIYKSFNDKDFTAIKLFMARGTQVCFLTADPANKKLAEDRNIPCFLSRNEKNEITKGRAYFDIVNTYGLSKANSEVWTVGDDLFDVELFKLCTMSFCPSDAAKYVKENATVVLTTPGGKGVVMELADRFLEDVVEEEVFKIVELDSHEGWSRNSR
jgi:3-deoxy-D-manno-octulosonate 8-phosphate phosphatase (KDO 8-P phosphatase)